MVVVLTASMILVGCSGQKFGNANGDSSGGTVRIQGSGSTFVKPLMDKWMSEYGKAHPNVKVDYQSTGSGAGIKAIQSQTSDFGATDAAMTEDEMKQSPSEIIHVPVVLGAVVLTYNLDTVKEALKLSPEVIADIYLGKIKKWDDPKIKADNPTAALPSNDITPVYRSDGSGTSDVFTDFLSKLNPEWKEKVGRTKNPQLPEGVGIGAKGNEGVMGQVKQTPNTIGYVELTFASLCSHLQRTEGCRQGQTDGRLSLVGDARGTVVRQGSALLADSRRSREKGRREASFDKRRRQTGPAIG
ncbi:MAG: phosphate ABC transporter substrate-binding protein PstS [Acidobacteria bacterium]|nr:phosphate ABC transporter substrate-binding protein PstS [Acidobacteriota bacterium]